MAASLKSCDVADIKLNLMFSCFLNKHYGIEKLKDKQLASLKVHVAAVPDYTIS